MRKIHFVTVIAIAASSQWAFGDRFYDGFEGSTEATSNDFFQWEGGAYSSIASGFAYEGSKALEFRFEGSSDLSEDSWAEKRFKLGSVQTELWVSYKLWVPENYFHRDGDGADNNKGLLMLWSGDYSGDGSGSTTSLHFGRPRHLGVAPHYSEEGDSTIYAAWRPNVRTTYNFFNDSDYRDDSPSPEEESMGIVKADHGTWIDWVIHVKASDIAIEPADLDGPGNGKVQVWKNGELVYNASAATNYRLFSGEIGWDQGYLLGWSNSGFNEQTVMHIDEFVIGTSAEDVNFNLVKPSFGDVIQKIN